jgi:hypothetical protein
VAGVLTFGDEGPAVSVTMRDVRCVMPNLDPDGGARAPEMMKAVVRVNGEQRGRVRRGDTHRTTGGGQMA